MYGVMRHHRFIPILCVFALCWALLLTACQRDRIEQDEFGIIKTKLNNGLTVIIQEDNTSPMVTILTRVLAGFLNESDSQTGLSHLLEQMHFKGTKKRPTPLKIWQEARAMGASMNAWTSYDETTYHLTLPSRYLEKGLEFQVDALTHPEFDPTELSREAEVVILEGKRGKDSPSVFIHEELKNIAFKQHRLKRRLFGPTENFRKLSRKDIISFFQQHYQANNMILTIVGDIHPRETLKAVRQHYGRIPSASVPDRNSPMEPPQNEFRYKRQWADIRNAYLALGFHVPEALHEDSYVLDIIEHLLGDGKSSRLYRKLRSEKQLVSDVTAGSEYYEDTGFFWITARLDGKQLWDAEVNLFSELHRLKEMPVSETELQKIKNKIETSYFLTQQTTFEQARRLSFFEHYGDYKRGRQYLRDIKSVQPADIQRVAKKYLNIDQGSLFEYLSQGQKAHAYSPEQMVSRFKKETRPVEPSPMRTETRPVDEEQARLKEPIRKPTKNLSLKRYELSNDAIVLLKEIHGVPIVSLIVLFQGGRLFEERKNNGVTELMLRASLYGTTTRTEAILTEALDQIGAKLYMINEADFFGYGLIVLNENLDEGLKILSDMILNPAFPEKILDREKRHLITDMYRLEDRPETYTYQLFREAALKNHPYGLSELGSRETILKMTPPQMVQWHAEMINSSDMVISAVGDFNTLDIRTSFENYFKMIKPRRKERKPIPPIEVPSYISENFKKRQKEQTAILIGFEAAAVNHPDYYPLKVLEALSSEPGGYFGHRLRTKEKLADIVYSRLYAYLKGGVFTTYTAVSPENEKKALRSLLEEYIKLKSDFIDEEELKTTQNYLRGLVQNRLQPFDTQAYEYARNEIYGKPPSAISDDLEKMEAVTVEDLNRVASTYFNIEKYTLGIVRGAHKTRSFISTPPKPIIEPKPKPKPEPKQIEPPKSEGL